MAASWLTSLIGIFRKPLSRGVVLSLLVHVLVIGLIIYRTNLPMLLGVVEPAPTERVFSVSLETLDDGQAVPAPVQGSDSKSAESSSVAALEKSAPTKFEFYDPHETKKTASRSAKPTQSKIVAKEQSPASESMPGPSGAGGESTEFSGTATTRGYAIGDPGVTGPVVMKGPKPPYPPSARRAGFEGKLILEIFIDTEGRVSDAVVLESSGRSDCDQSAKDTITTLWRFKPAQVFGTTVVWQQKVAVRYDLR